MTRGRENKPHIGIYGRCNSGKSTLFNALTNGDFSIISEQPGTTTDPVRKSCEILDFAPVIFIDTAGLDDSSGLGDERIRKTYETLTQIDLALVVFSKWGGIETSLIGILTKNATPFILIHNRVFGAPLSNEKKLAIFEKHTCSLIEVNALSIDDISKNEILDTIRGNLPEKSYIIPSLFGGRVSSSEIVLLVCPIDTEAPSGRLILPQVQAIRDLLDNRAIAVVVQPSQIENIFNSGINPVLVVTDSQAFAEVRNLVPPNIELTSFSILLAQLKGDFELYKKGLEAVARLSNGDHILILENCIHQTSCEDIGRVKIPHWLKEYTGKSLNFTFISGLAPLPADMSKYSLAVQCGGCMVTRSQLMNRIRAIDNANIPITNYGMLINVLTKK